MSRFPPTKLRPLQQESSEEEEYDDGAGVGEGDEEFTSEEEVGESDSGEELAGEEVEEQRPPRAVAVRRAQPQLKVKAPKKTPEARAPKGKKKDPFAEVDEKTFYTANIKPNSNFLICGLTHTGKTESVRLFILNNRKMFSNIAVLCPTALSQPNAYDYLPPGCVNTKPTSADLEAIVARQEAYIEEGKVPPRVLVILDDWVGRQSMKMEVFDKVMASGRHLNLSLVVVCQSLKGVLRPATREAFPQIFVTKLKGTNIEALADCVSSVRSVKELETFLAERPPYQVTRFDGESGYDLQPFYLHTNELGRKFKLSTKVAPRAPVEEDVLSVAASEEEVPVEEEEEGGLFSWFK